MRVDELPTPAALLDLDVLERNARTMRERCALLGVTLRPHVKTHGCGPAALAQVGDGPRRATVATLAEAREMQAAGFRDLTWAVPPSPGRLREAAGLARGLDRFSLLADSEEALAAITACARQTGVRFGVFIEVDCGNRRSGVDPASRDSLRLCARIAGEPGVDFRGVLAHGGQAYRCRTMAEVADVARQERDLTVGFAEALRAEALRVPEVSIGSTPTLAAATDLRGVTEVRPGNYLLHDLFQVQLGACRLEDVAFTVLGSVIDLRPEHGRAVLDTGALALSLDPGSRDGAVPASFGMALAGAAMLPLASLSQEHGVIRAAAEQVATLRWGRRLRVVPNHSCLAAACHDRYALVRGDEVVGEWRRCRGW